jgi:hypothetical protein
MDKEEEIRKVAYELYERSGRVPGREIENWLKAEKIVMARYAEGDKPPARPQMKKTVVKTKTATADTPKNTVKKTKAKKAGSPKKTKTVER